VRLKGAPPGFVINQILFVNWLMVITFAALVVAALLLRRRSDWHRRLMHVGTAALIAPGLARLLPMPMLGPYGPWVVLSGVLAFPAIGMLGDRVLRGRVHPAWWLGIAMLLAQHFAAGWIGFSPVGLGLTRLILAGSPQAGALAGIP
jgi:hypothetical protein